MVTETRDPGADAGRGLREVRQGMDDAAVLHQPARRSPAEGAGHPDAEGRARLSHRRAREAHLLRRHPEVLPRARGRDAARARSRRSASPTKTASSSSSGSRRTRTSRTCSRTATTSRRSPIRAGCREAQITQLIATTKPHYHLMGGLHSGETGPSEMLMELVYRLATETSPLIKQIRDNVIVSITPVADPDGRDRNVDWFYRNAGAAGGRRPRRRRAGAGARRRRRGAAAAAAAAAADAAAPARAVLGQVRLPRQQPRHQPVAGVDARASPTGTSPRIRRSCTTCTSRCRCSTPTAAAAPQNPNLDPILFAELPFFSNFELAQMTKWGMPGVYTHAFMDGWSPGYLGSVAYNHNGMMRMYETQSGSDGAARRAARRPAAAPVQRRGAAAAPAGAAGRGAGGGRGGEAAGGARTRRTRPRRRRRRPRGERAAADGEQRTRRGAGSAPAGRGAAAAGPPTGRGGGQPREWYRGIPIPPGAAAQLLAPQQHQLHADRRAVARCSSRRCSRTWSSRTSTARRRTRSRRARPTRRTASSFPVQRDMTRVAELVNILRVQRIEVGQATAEIKIGDGTFPAGSYVIKRDQPYGRLAKNLLERQSYPDPNLRTYDDSGWTMGLAMLVDVKEIKDKAILDVADDAGQGGRRVKGKVTGTGQRRARGRALRLEQHDRVPLQAAERADEDRRRRASPPTASSSRPARSSSRRPPTSAAVRAAVEQLGLTAAALTRAAGGRRCTTPTLPRVAIYSSWTGTQEIGWVRFTLRQVRHPVRPDLQGAGQKGNLRARLRRHRDADAERRRGRRCSQPPAARPVPYMKDATSTSSSACTASRPTSPAAWAARASTRSRSSSTAAARSITMGNAVRFPTELGLARTVDASGDDVGELLRAAAARQRRGPAARSSGVLRLHRQDHADQVPRRPADDASASPIRQACWRATSAATRRC